jgi:hypothetical protein
MQVRSRTRSRLTFHSSRSTTATSAVIARRAGARLAIAATMMYRRGNSVKVNGAGSNYARAINRREARERVGWPDPEEPSG